MNSGSTSSSGSTMTTGVGSIVDFRTTGDGFVSIITELLVDFLIGVGVTGLTMTGGGGFTIDDDLGMLLVFARATSICASRSSGAMSTMALQLTIC